MLSYPIKCDMVLNTFQSFLVPVRLKLLTLDGPWLRKLAG